MTIIPLDTFNQRKQVAKPRKLKPANETIHLSVVAPAFNEEEGIERVVSHWIKFCENLPRPAEIVIVNDGSKDRTREILEGLAEAHDCLRVISYEPNGGYGAALTSAITHSRGDWVMTIDSDGQFEVEDYYALWTAIEESGASCAAGIRRKNDTVVRVLADRALRLYGRILFGAPAKDPNCAIKLCRGNLLRAMSLESRGYSSPSEIFYQLTALGEKIVQVPVNHLPRLAGVSKLKLFGAATNVLFFLLYLRLKVTLHRRGVLYLYRPLRTPVADTAANVRPLIRKKVRK